jgi:hypothetical protein
MKHIFLAIALLFSAHLARSAPLGAVVQSSTYDPTNGVTTVHIVNVSHKDITAFIISTKETRADGTVEEGEQMYEFLTTMISVAESGGTIPSVHGSGAFAPGESREETFQHSSKGTQVQLEVTVVAYADATAQVTDQRAFQNLVTQRQSRVAAMRKTNEVIKQTLADPSVKNHRATIAAELARLAIAYKKSTDALASAEASSLEFANIEIPQDEASLAAFTKVIDHRIALTDPHVNPSLVEVQP